MRRARAVPSRWELPLPGVAPGEVRWEHLHAVVSGWFDHDDEQHHQPVKPYAVSPPRNGRHDPVVEIGLLDDTLVERFLQQTREGARIRLGRTTITFREAPRQLAAASWDQLTTGRREMAWCLRFATPMTIRRGNRFTPLPAPTPILGSLRRNWNTYAPAEHAVTLDLGNDPVWVTDIDGHNEVVSVNGRTVSGFVGRLRMETDDGAAADAASQLIRLAPFAGVGAYTTRCFGVTRVDGTWQPRR